MSKPTKPNPEVVLESLRPLWRGSERALADSFAYCLREMLLLYYPPFRADSDVELTDLTVTGIRAYVEDLAEFQPEVLAEGWRQARRGHKVERWPTISDIRDRCQSVAADRSGVRPDPVIPAERQDRKPLEKFPHRAMADGWMSSDQGQWALRVGCGPDCWDYVAERGEFPTRDQLAKIRDHVAGRAARIGHVEPGSQAAQWLKTMTDRDERMRGKFLRERDAA